MARVRVEFDYGGRTYTLEPVHKWNIHIVNLLRDKVTFETDVRTGEKLFVVWNDIPVIRLVSQVDGEGNPISSPPMHTFQRKSSVPQSW